MSCECCCKNVLRLCRVSVCGDALIKFGTTAQLAGVHKMTLNFLGVEFSVSKTFTVGQAIEFPATSLNESHTYTAKLFDPNGAQIVIQKGAVEYDCFEFETVLAYTVEPVTSDESVSA